MSQFFGLEIAQSQHGIKSASVQVCFIFFEQVQHEILQAKQDFLSRVKLEESNSSFMVNNTLYRKLIGCFLYLKHTQNDIYYEVIMALIYMDQHHEIHWRAAKRILNFVQGIRTHGIFYKAKFDLDLIG